MSPRVQVRPARPGDEAGLVQLFSSAYGRTLSEERWRWKLGRFATPPNAWVAEIGGTLVCQYAAMPAAARVQGRDAAVMVAVDAMTAPEHRRRGLLTTVVKRAHDAWRQDGVSLVLGLPNERWGSRTQALGWTPLFELRRMAFPLRPADILRRRFGALVGAGVGPLAEAWFRGRRQRSGDPGGAPRVGEVSEAGPVFDTLWGKARGSASQSICRDATWVGWRFVSSVEPGYRVLLVGAGSDALGWSAIRVDRSRGHAVGLVADLVADPSRPDAWRAVAEAAMSALAAEGAETASTLAAEGSPRYERLLEQGFVARPQAFKVHAVVLEAGLDGPTLGRAAAWDMAGGDFDVI